MSGHRPWTWTAPAEDWDKTPLPMRPSGDDLTFREEAIAAWVQERGIPRVLILGVTPQYFRLPWPKGTSILAVDRSLPMIESVWPGGRETVLLADWTQIPLRRASRDIALCDGGLSILSYPDGLDLAARELARIVAPGGRAIFRLYVPPAEPVTAAQVVAEARAGKLATSMELSIRFWGALHDPATMAYKAGESLGALEALGVDPYELFASQGWDAGGVKVIEDLRAGDVWLWFPTVEQVAAAFAPAFTLEEVRVPSYRMGEVFPTVLFRRRS